MHHVAILDDVVEDHKKAVFTAYLTTKMHSDISAEELVTIRTHFTAAAAHSLLEKVASETQSEQWHILHSYTSENINE